MTRRSIIKSVFGLAAGVLAKACRKEDSAKVLTDQLCKLGTTVPVTYTVTFTGVAADTWFEVPARMPLYRCEA